ncbi:unnamed protein product, partial [Phaeothamnion confervicola]
VARPEAVGGRAGTLSAAAPGGWGCGPELLVGHAPWRRNIAGAATPAASAAVAAGATAATTPAADSGAGLLVHGQSFLHLWLPPSCAVTAGDGAGGVAAGPLLLHDWPTPLLPSQGSPPSTPL